MQSIYFDGKQTKLINSWIIQANETSNEYLKFMSNWIAFNAICYNLYHKDAVKNQTYLNSGRSKLPVIKRSLNKEGKILASSTSINLKNDTIEIDIKATERLKFRIRESYTENLIFSEFVNNYSSKIVIDQSLFLELKNSLEKYNRHYVINMAQVIKYEESKRNNLTIDEISEKGFIVLCEDNTLETVKDVLYQIRCNIFHGEKTVGDFNDDRIVKYANPILKQINQFLIGDLGITVNEIKKEVIENTKKLKSPIKIKDLPILRNDFTSEQALKNSFEGYAENQKAKIFISKPGDYYSEEKIVIIWDEPHPTYGESFTTKYYYMKEDGILEWGENNPPIILHK
jgi:hypothetical protein